MCVNVKKLAQVLAYDSSKYFQKIYTSIKKPFCVEVPLSQSGRKGPDLIQKYRQPTTEHHNTPKVNTSGKSRIL